MVQAQVADGRPRVGVPEYLRDYFRPSPRLILLCADHRTDNMEHKMVNQNGCVVTIIFVEKQGNYLLKMINQKGAMHLMFIKDAEAEVEMLNREGYVEVKELSDLGHNGFILTIEFFLW